jgi:2,4-dienoyl-CoA reductase (NADPH2)
MRELFEPIAVGAVQIKNRFALLPMGMGYCRDGHVTDQLIHFNEARAAGGAGLIYVVGTYNDFGFGNPRFVALEDDRFLPGMKRLTDVLHGHGAKVFVQLMHMGASAPSLLLGHQPVSASAVRSALTGEMPRELTIPEISETIAHFAEAAARAKEGGFDGVELINQGGYLINQFLSPLTNLRTDEYGGSFENRLRFPIAAVRTVRDAVGPGFPIAFRTCGDEFMRGGNTYKEIRLIAREVARAGVDLLSVSAGWHQSFMPLIPMVVPRGGYVYLAQGIKEVVDIPVLAANRINNPSLAREIVRNGQADMVGMARALLADAELPKKTAEGRIREIRPCVACNQGCFDTIFSAEGVTCLLNPAVGKEREYAVTPALRSKQVVVVGGGPGGLAAAQVLAERGHRVTLFEKADRLGGQLNLAAIPPERREFAEIIRYYADELARLNVTVRLGEEASPEAVAALAPEAVVIAAGARPIRPPLPGIDGGNVVYAGDVLEGRVKLGRRVAVVGGGATGAETALFIAKVGALSPEAAVFLAARGGLSAEEAVAMTCRGIKDVTILEMLGRIGDDIGRSTRWTVLQSLKLNHVETITKARVVRIVPEGVFYLRDGREQLLPADTVVIAVGAEAEGGMEDSFRDLAPECYAVGDCVRPRKILDAIHEAWEAARRI